MFECSAGVRARDFAAEGRGRSFLDVLGAGRRAWGSGRSFLDNL